MPSDRTICVVLSDDLDKAVRAQAERDTVPISAIVRQALKLYFFAKGSNNTSGPVEAV